MLQYVVPIGTICMVFNPRSINSDLTSTKASWLVAMGTIKGSVQFWSPITGSTTSSKSYVEVSLPQGYNYEDFFGLENTTRAGAHMKHGKKRVMLPHQEGRRLLVITGLSERIIPAKPRDDIVLQYRGIKAPPFIIMDKDTKERFTMNEDGEMSLDEPRTVIYSAEPEPAMVDEAKTSEQILIEQLHTNPASFKGETFSRMFFEGEDCNDFTKTPIGIFDGLITHGITDDGETY